MHKLIAAMTAFSISVTPALAQSGHVIQVHHGADCVEFAIWEDAIATCGASMVFLSSGTVNSACMSLVPWYGIETGQGTGQTPLTVAQLPFFIAGTSAIDTAFYEWQGVNGALDVQVLGQGLAETSNETALLLGPSSALGFTGIGTLTCKDINNAGATHTVTSVANLNTPPAPTN